MNVINPNVRLSDTELKARRRQANRVLLSMLTLMSVLVVVIGVMSRVQPPDPVLSSAPVTDSRLLRFEQAEDEELRVFDGDTGALIMRIPRGEETFIRGALRVVGRERTVHRVDPATSLALTVHDDGAVILRDPGSGVVYDLRAYGVDNLAAFVQLLEEPMAQAIDPAPDAAAPSNLQTRTLTRER